MYTTLNKYPRNNRHACTNIKSSDKYTFFFFCSVSYQNHTFYLFYTSSVPIKFQTLIDVCGYIKFLI